MVCGKKKPTGWIKCTVDASFPDVENKVGIGICVRDECGISLGARTQWISPILDVSKAEAMGLLLAIQWVRELGFKIVIFSAG